MRFLRPGDGPASGAAEPPPDVWPFTLAAHDPCFAGHFDDDPILPGVMHIAVALEACTLLNPGLPPLVACEDVRFLRPVRPGDICQVAISAGRDGAAWRFEVVASGEAASRGGLIFAAPWTRQ